MTTKTIMMMMMLMIKILQSIFGTAKLLRKLEEKMKLEARKELALSCQVSLGSPSADVQWYCNGKKILSDEKYNITTEGDTMKLTIKECEATDSATYRCDVINKLGEVQTECCVQVLRAFRFFIDI